MGRLRRQWQARPAGAVTHVVTVSAAQERFLDETLEWVRRQTYASRDELVVEWGAGREFADIATARNHALASASSPMVRLVEAGDILPWHSTALLVRALRGGPNGSSAGRTSRGSGWRDAAFAPAAGTDPGLADRVIDRAAWVRAGIEFDPSHGRFGDVAVAACEHELGCNRIDQTTFEDHHRTLGLPFGHVRVWSTEATSRTPGRFTSSTSVSSIARVAMFRPSRLCTTKKSGTSGSACARSALPCSVQARVAVRR